MTSRHEGDRVCSTLGTRTTRSIGRAALSRNASVQPLSVQITTLNACILVRIWGWVALMIKDDSSHPPHILRTPGDHHARHPSNQSRVEEANTIQNSQS